MTTTIETMKTKRTAPPMPLLVVGIVLALAGIGAWIYQLVAGMQVTGLGQHIVWGLYIGGFFTAVGAGAGLLTLAGISEFYPLLPITSRTKTLVLALASFVTGALLIAVDVGNPIQMWRVITAFRFSSMMTWDFWLLVVVGLVALIYLLTSKTGKPNKMMGILGILAAILVVAVEGWMLTVQSARPFWGSGLTVVSFLLGAGIAGMSLAVLFIPSAKKLRPVLTTALVISLVLVISEIFTGLLSKSTRTSEEIRVLLTGFPAPFFWFHLLAGLLLALTLFLRSNALALAAGLAFLGVFSEKIWLLATGQAESWLPLSKETYFPTWVEFVAIIGILAIGWLIYTGLEMFVEKRQTP